MEPPQSSCDNAASWRQWTWSGPYCYGLWSHKNGVSGFLQIISLQIGFQNFHVNCKFRTFCGFPITNPFVDFQKYQPLAVCIKCECVNWLEKWSRACLGENFVFQSWPSLVQSRGRVSHYFEMQGLTRETKDKKDRFFILQFESLDWHKCFYHFRPQLFS